MSLLAMVTMLTRIEAVQINPNLGTIVLPRGQLNAAVSKLHLMAKLDAISEVPEIEYPTACSYFPEANKLFLRDFNIGYPNMVKEYKTVCQTYDTIRETALTLRKALLDTSDMGFVTICDLKPRVRQKRSFGKLVRRMFNIASYRQQKQLERTVNNIADQMFTQEGKLEGLRYITKIHNEQISTLSNITSNYFRVMTNITDHLRQLNKRLQDEYVLHKHSTIWISDAIVAGVLYNQLITAHNEHLRTRIKALGDLAQGRLLPELISPSQLEQTLNYLRSKLTDKYNGIRLSEINIWEYYSIHNVMSFSRNGSIYLSIPVRIEVVNQIYDLYEIQTFITPVDSQSPQATFIVVDNVEMLGVNEMENSYIPLSKALLREACKGKSIYHCNHLFTQYDITKAPSCAIAIYLNKLDDIRNLCEIGFLEIEPTTNPSFIDLGNSSVLMINPARHMIYSRCNNHARKEPLTDNALTTITMNCFCYLLNDEVRTAIYADENCIEQTTITINPTNHVNLVFIAYMLNKSMSQIDTLNNMSYYDKLPHINVPEYLEGLIIPKFHLGPVYDFKKVLQLQKTDYMDTLYGKVSTNTKTLRIIGAFKIIVYVISFIVIVIIVGTLILTCKVKLLTRLVVIGKLIKPIQSLPLTNNQDDEGNGMLQLSWEIMSTAIFIMALIYWIVKHIHWCRTIYKYCAYPFQDLSLSKTSNAQTVILYLASINEFCYIHLDTMNINPDDVTIKQSVTDVKVELHESMCSSYITLHHTDLSLQIGPDPNNVWTLNNAISIPVYLKNTVRYVLSRPFKIEILIGSNNIYRTFPVEMTKQQDE